jgi:regulator of sirC expression with transglutaminase-like and TPR domain
LKPLEARALFEQLVAVPEDEIDLVRAALAVAAEEDPALDVEAWAHRIDGLAFRGLAAVSPTAGEAERLRRLYELFFDELGFSGRGADFDDPGSSFLHTVVDRRNGIPIALAVLFVRIGRRMGLSCAGVGFPGHFLAKVVTSEGEIFVDPFSATRSVTLDDLAQRLARATSGRQKLDRWMLAAATPKQILARMLRNLKNLYSKQRDFARAFSAVDRVLLVQPEAHDDLRDRGLYCATLGGNDAARRDLTLYLERVPQAPDAAQIRGKLRALGTARVLLN